MPKRTIRHVFFQYKDAEGRRLVAYAGDTLDLPQSEVDRGESLGSFEGSEPITAASQEPVPSSREVHERELVGDPPGNLDVLSATDEELDAFVAGANAPEVVDAAAGNATLASRLLDAEERVKDEPRKTVAGPLEDLIAEGTQ